MTEKKPMQTKTITLILCLILPLLLVGESTEELIEKADILYARHRYRQALETFEKALRFEPHNAVIHHRMGNTWFKLKDLDKALDSFEKAVRYDPEDALALAKIGGIYYLRKDPEKALHYLRQAARLGDPTAQRALKSRGYDW